MATIIQDFKNFKNIFPQILEMSGYKMEFLAQRLSMSATGFSTKKKKNNFSIEQMEQLMDIVWNDYLEEKFLTRAMDEAKNEEPLSKEDTAKIFSSWK